MALFYLQDCCLSSNLDSKLCRSFGTTGDWLDYLPHSYRLLGKGGRGPSEDFFVLQETDLCNFDQTTLCTVSAYNLFPTFIHLSGDPRHEVKHWDDLLGIFPLVFLVHSKFCFFMLIFTCLCLCCLLVRFALKCFFVRVDGGGNST